LVVGAGSWRQLMVVGGGGSGEGDGGVGGDSSGCLNAVMARARRAVLATTYHASRQKLHVEASRHSWQWLASAMQPPVSTCKHIAIRKWLV
jgi:hypothetical protein